MGDVSSIRFKRFDEETLRAQLCLADWAFTPVFLWCPETTSQEGNEGWLLTELLPCPELDDSWSPSISHANDSAKERILSEALREAEGSSSSAAQPRRPDLPRNESDYWAQYDQSQEPTPMRKPPPKDQENMSEADYFARYGEVQPAMDNHDPDEEMQGGGGAKVESTLNGHARDYQRLLSQQQQTTTSTSPTLSTDRSPPPYQDPATDHRTTKQDRDVKMTTTTEVAQPHPASPSSRGGSDAIAHLEDVAQRTSASEVGMKQHISTSIKSMYTLARSMGMERDEFETLVATEVDGLR